MSTTTPPHLILFQDVGRALGCEAGDDILATAKALRAHADAMERERVAMCGTCGVAAAVDAATCPLGCGGRVAVFADEASAEAVRAGFAEQGRWAADCQERYRAAEQDHVQALASLARLREENGRMKGAARRVFMVWGEPAMLTARAWTTGAFDDALGALVSALSTPTAVSQDPTQAESESGEEAGFAYSALSAARQLGDLRDDPTWKADADRALSWLRGFLSTPDAHTESE